MEKTPAHPANVRGCMMRGTREPENVFAARFAVASSKEHFVSHPAKSSRRKFLERVNLAFTGFAIAPALPFQTAAAAQAPAAAPAPAATPTPASVDSYDTLAVTKPTNAAG